MNELYCNIVDGIILQGPIQLPNALQNIKKNELKRAGWIPAKIVKPSPDNVYTTLIGPDVIIEEDLITFEYKLQRFDDESIIFNLKKIKYDLINKERDKLKEDGFNYNGYIYDSDMTSLINIVGKMMELLIKLVVEKENIENIEKFIWRTKDNQDILHSVEDFCGVFYSLAQYGTTLYINSWLKKKQLMEDLTTIEEIELFSPLLN